MRAYLLIAPLLLAGCPGPAATGPSSPEPEDAVTMKLPAASREPSTPTKKPSAGPVPTPSPRSTPSGSPTPPGSGFASPTPGPAGPGSVGFSLAFSAAAGDNADRSAFTASETQGSWTPAAGDTPLDALRVVGTQTTKKQRTFALALHLKPTVGKTYTIANNDRILEGATLRYQEYETFVTWAWLATAGNAEVVSVAGNRVGFKLSGVRLEPEPGNTAAKGAFTVDGSATADVVGL